MISDLTYSAGPDEDCWHDENARISFPRSQHLYGRAWNLVATDLANDFHCSHDGWESSWPLQLRIYEAGVELVRFTVEREYTPIFTAYEAEPKTGEA